jgi:hypothetical protein
MLQTELVSAFSVLWATPNLSLLLTSKNGLIALKNNCILLRLLNEIPPSNLELSLSDNGIKVLSSERLTSKDKIIIYSMPYANLKYFLSDETIQAWQEGKISLQQINDMSLKDISLIEAYRRSVVVTPPNTQQNDPQNGPSTTFKP